MASSANRFDLSWLLAPLSVQEFIDEYWEQHPHVIARDDPDYYAGLFGKADFDSVLEFGRPRPPDLRVLSGTNSPSASEYVQSDGRLDLNQLAKFYVEGHTIVIHGLHRFWRPVAEMLQVLQRRLSYELVPNAYLTPRASQGLLPHYDTHDVFIVQVGGAKQWRLYHAEVAYPLPGTVPPRPFSRDELSEPRVIELSAGDVMYIPRGWVHEAETVDESSLHLTLGVFPALRYDFFGKALAGLALKHERLRRALPLGYLDDGDVLQTLSRELRDLASLLENESEASAAEAYDMLQDDFIRLGRSAPDGQFVSVLDRLPSIDLQTHLVKRPHLYSRTVPLGSDSVAIQYSKSLVQGPADYGDAMNFVSRSDAPFAVSDLPGLNDDRKVSLAQRLVRDGLLTLADADLRDDGLRGSRSPV